MENKETAKETTKAEVVDVKEEAADTKTAKTTTKSTAKTTTAKKSEEAAPVENTSTQPVKEAANTETAKVADKSVKAAEPVAEKQEVKKAEAQAKEVKPETAVEPKKIASEDIPADAEPAYPFTVKLCKAIATYRGPSIKLVSKQFGGKVTVLSSTTNGFYKVSFVRSGVGLTTCYMLRQEVERCRS